MAFDFPASPSEGQIFNAPGGPSYVFNNPVWKAVGQGQIAIISDTPPSNPANGALWYESDSGVLFIWMNDGNSSQWVQVGGIQAGAPVPPAADNNEYTMVNGAWRLRSQSFDLAGKTQQDMTVPDWGPSQARLTVFVFASGMYGTRLRLSTDGATFPAGAGDYTSGGFIHYNGSAGFATLATVSGSSFILTDAGDNAGVPHRAVATVQLQRPTGAGSQFSCQVFGNSFNNAPTSYFMTTGVTGYTQSAAFPGNGPVKALRWFQSAGSAAMGKLTVEWLL